VPLDEHRSASIHPGTRTSRIGDYDPRVPRHVAFLRAINIGGRRASREQLTTCLESLGFENVATFRASGNLIFDADRESEAALIARINDALTQSLGYEVRAFLRNAPQVREIAAMDPFPPKVVRASGGRLQVALLAKPPAKPVRNEVLSMATDADPLAVHGRELYWLPSGGTMQTDLNLRAIDNLVGENTRRTKSMIEEIAAKFLAH
jgi:uncharacterized protein (DUF1697 family)